MFQGANKCLPLDAPILMADGTWRELEKIKIGDRVIGCNYVTGIAEPTEVIDTSRAGKKIVYKINFNDGGYVVASEEHSFPMLWKAGSYKMKNGKKSLIVPKKRTIKSIIGRNVSLSCKTRFLKPRQVHFESYKANILPIDSYLIGALLGDGSVNKTFAFTNGDKVVIDRVEFCLNKLGYKLKRISKYDYRISQIVKSNKCCLRNELRRLGIFGKNSGTKFIPLIYKTADIESRKQLLSGLIDTDGSWEEFTSKSEQLVKDFVFLVNSIGGKATYCKTEKICTNNGKKGIYYRCHYYLNEKLPLLVAHKNLYKNGKAYSRNKQIRVVKNIEELGEVECGDIQVAHPSHTYISYDWIITGNTGKTTTGIDEDVSHALGYRPFLQKSDPDYKTQFKTPVKIRIVGEDFGKHVGGVIVPQLYEWIPRSEFTFREGNPKKNQQGIPVFWTFNNGSTIELMSYEQDVDFFEGWDGDIVHFDEPPPRNIYIACKRGLVVKGGLMMFSMTPLKEPWIYDEIVLKSQTTESVFFIISEMRDNLIHEREWYGKKVLCGALKEENIVEFESALTDDEKEVRIKGRFMHLSGLVYKEFDVGIHRIPWFLPRGHYTWYEAIDPHPRKPKAITIMAVAPDDTKYIVDEIWMTGVVKDISEAILQKRKFYNYTPKFTLIDPRAVEPDEISNTTVLNEYIKESNGKIHPQCGSKDRARGIDLLKKELKMENSDKAGIYVMENCKETLFEFGHYIWAKPDEIENVKGKDEPKKANDHMLENIHRILIAGATYVPPKDEATKRVIKGIGR